MARLASFRAVLFVAAIQSLVIISLGILPEFLSPQPSGSSFFVFLFLFGRSLAAYLALALAWNKLLHPALSSPLRNIPRPKTKWAINRLIHVLSSGRQSNSGELLMDIVRNTPNTGLLILNGFIVPDHLLVTSVPLLAELLVRHPYDFKKPSNTQDFMRHFLGDGLVTAEGDQHKLLRKKNLSAFTHRHNQNLYPMMWKKALSFRDELQVVLRQQNEKATSGKAEIFSWASRISFDIICTAALGRDSNTVQHPDSDSFYRDHKAVTGPHMLLYWAMSMWLSFRFVKMLPWQKNREFLSGTYSLHNTCYNMVKDKKVAIASNAELGTSSEDKRNTDILSLLIQSGEQFDDMELGNQLLGFLSAGHVTTAAALTWACYLLSKHPDWQTELREEIRGALTSTLTADPDKGKHQSNIAHVLESLPVLNGVLNETLRLYPPVPYITREASCDTVLGEQPIPKGTHIAISSWVINRSPGLWGPEADVFKPERWIDVLADDTGGGASSPKRRPNKSGGATSNYHCMTFLHGPRSCIGEDFARAELRCLVAALASRFEWTLDMEDEEVVPAGNVTMKPLHGLHLNMNILDE